MVLVFRRLWRWSRPIGFLLLTAELALRILYADLLVEQHFPLVYVPDDALGYRYRTGVSDRICVPSICREFQIDSEGYVGGPKKLRDTRGFEVVIAASSDATGIWMQSGIPYPSQLRDLLLGRGCNVDVVNAAVDGDMRSLEIVRVARHEIELRKPDALVLELDVPLVTQSAKRSVYGDYVLSFPADVKGSEFREREVVNFLQAHAIFREVYLRSYLLRASVRLMMRHSKHWSAFYLDAFVTHIVVGDLRPRVLSVGRSIRELVALRDAMAGYGGILLLVGNPHSRLAKLAPSYGLDFAPVAVPSGRKFRFRYDGHLNSAGHRAIALQLRDSLLAACIRHDSP